MFRWLYVAVQNVVLVALMDDFGELLNTAHDARNVARTAVLDESSKIGAVDELQSHEHRLADVCPSFGIVIEELGASKPAKVS